MWTACTDFSVSAQTRPVRVFRSMDGCTMSIGASECVRASRIKLCLGKFTPVNDISQWKYASLTEENRVSAQPQRHCVLCGIEFVALLLKFCRYISAHDVRVSC